MSNRNFEAEAQQAAEAHLDKIVEFHWNTDEEDGPEEGDPSIGPWCGGPGCQTCTIREVLMVAWPILMEAARQEVLEEAKG